MRFPIVVLLSACVLMLATPLLAQSPNGVLNGQVVDPSNGVIIDADVVAVNDVTGVQYTAKTNNEGIYVLQNLPPGPYRLQVSKVGFKTLVKPDITLNVQDALAINFTLPVGALSETVTVEGGAPLVNTESAAVSTVVDRHFAENLPMNGRSFQTLIQLTPGVVVAPSQGYDPGQFSVNGQRTSSNYWMVDGVSANFGVSAGYTGGVAGSLGSFSALGGTNSLVSVDALQEFRIQTSTYAPEFGRTPGAQISILTRSGTNRLHGTVFEYLRNDVFDANDWFADSKGLPKADERQNDFGGTFSGPVIKDRTFFFFSYEGLRLRLPQTTLTTVPDINARQTAVSAMQPYLNAYPVPNGPEILDENGDPTGAAELNASFSNSSSLDASSLRIDHKLTNTLAMFGRYDYSPSRFVQRAGGSDSLNTTFASHITTQTTTLGVTWMPSHAVANDLRFNYSRANASTAFTLDDFGGAVPIAAPPFPTPFTTQVAQFVLGTFSLSHGFLIDGMNQKLVQQQYNVVDNLSVQKGPHSLKFGVDFRRLSPLYAPPAYGQQVYFSDVPSSQTGNLLLSFITSGSRGTLLFHNLGIFAQDSWRLNSRLILTYGLRWDVDFAPQSGNGPNLPAVTGFNLNDLSQLALAPAETTPFKTTYGNFAPRIGVAYQISQSPSWGLVARGGFGAFYDLATQEVGNVIGQSAYPFYGSKFNCCFNGTFPLDPATAAAPPIVPPGAGSGTLSAFDPNLRLPYTLQWNVALEQSLGGVQTVSASYVGSIGRRLIQSEFVSDPNPNFANAYLIGNTATSDYHALQLQFHRRLSRGLQALLSYSWSHSIDTASSGAYGNGSNTLIPSVDPAANRGPSDFDIRNQFAGGLTYEVPAPKSTRLVDQLLSGWSVNNILQIRSAPPVNVYDSSFSGLFNALTEVRPDLVPGVPLYLGGSQFPGSKAFNPAAFTAPPLDSNGAPLRQGDLARNALRGFGAWQWDFAVHRDFPLHESLQLQFRAEMFNVLNHPNFGSQVADLNNPQFGQSTQMLGQSLNQQGMGGGGFSPLYQLGGPRSIQMAVKFIF
jgi:hypothetical protein